MANQTTSSHLVPDGACKGGRPQAGSKKPRWGHRLTRLALLFVAVFTCVAASELAVRLFVPVRNVGPSFSVYHPVYGKMLKRSFTCRRITPEFTMRFSSNSLGFRGPEPASLPKRVVLFMGDSFTMGYGVDDGCEYPSLVQRALATRYGPNAIPVVNAGMGANGNGRWVKILSHQAQRYDPRLVVLQVTSNDFGDNARERLFEMSPTNELIECPVPSPRIARLAQGFIESIPGLSYSYLVGLARQAITAKDARAQPSDIRARPDRQGNSKTNTAWSPAEVLTFALIEKSLSICKENNWPVVMIAVECRGRYLAGLQEYCRRYDVPLLTVPTKRERPSMYYKVDGHWNEAGHAFVAHMLMDHLVRNDVLMSPAMHNGPQVTP